MADDYQQTATDDAEEDGGVQSILSERAVVDENWARYTYVSSRGHDEYCRQVRRLENFVLGGGLQWSDEDKQTLKEQKRMPLEFNEILPAIKAAAGYQIANRMDISYQPRAGMATQDIANILSKVSMQVADNNEYHWLESDVFLDGMIQRRGFFDIRIDFDDSMRGEIRLDSLDPMDVLPDPDAKSYDPAKWNDVIITRWLSIDEIGQRYGQKAAKHAEAMASGKGGYVANGESDFGDGERSSEPRSKFGDTATGEYYGSLDSVRPDSKGRIRLRVIDRQYYVYQFCQVIVSPDTGDVRVVEGIDPMHVALMQARGGILSKRLSRRVKWTVTTCDAVLHDDWSPYPWLTVVPFFPFFRRGRSIGMVDNAVGPQEALNKLGSQFIHIINSTANSGWKIKSGSLKGMDVEDLRDEGSKTGLVLELEQVGDAEKIQPNQIPSGVDRMMDRVRGLLKENTVPDAARGVAEGAGESGITVQSRQHAAQQQLATELDNLSRTRKLLAQRILWCIQTYYDEERIYRITKPDSVSGQPQQEDLKVNYEDPATGEILNDLTIGEYEAVISEVPMQITFENGQFEQAMRMREGGIKIPDDIVIKSSTLPDKKEVIQRMAADASQPDPTTEAENNLTNAQARKADAEATSTAVQTQFSAVQTAQIVAQIPATAPLADAILGSAGFVDHDGAPVIPTPAAGIAAGINNMPHNTHPLDPAHADTGMDAGIEGGKP